MDFSESDSNASQSLAKSIISVFVEDTRELRYAGVIKPCAAVIGSNSGRVNY